MHALSTGTLAQDRLILAVDTSSIAEVRSYLAELAGLVGMFKVGLQLFVRYGPEILNLFQKAGVQVFLDCKFLDIPNTVARASEEATAHGVQMFTVHACGGRTMLRLAADAAREKAMQLNLPEPMLLGVTVLTSVSSKTLVSEMHVSCSMEDHVLHLARSCKESGIRGLVASPEEVGRLRRELGNDIVIVTPGIRPNWADNNDQSRIATPFEAIKNGSDYLVVGRPITQASAPKDAARRIVAEIEEALAE